MPIETLKTLYTTRHPKHDERLATAAPLSVQARALRDEHAALLAAHADVAHKAATLDLKSLARYVAPDLLPVVRKLYDAAKGIAGAGTTTEAVAAVRRVEAGVDRDNDREYEFNVQEARKQVDRLAGSLAVLRRDADAMVMALASLIAAPSIASSSVMVPKPDVSYFLSDGSSSSSAPAAASTQTTA